MKQSGVSAFARAARRLAVLAAVALGLGAGSLSAQTSTGKIEGRVRDNNGTPLQSAQVTIDGTAFSALTNAQGYYFINNVPASTITLRSRLVGYRGTVVSGLKILAGQTITQDFQLEPSAVEIAPVVAEATNALVPRDEVATKQRIDGRFTEQLPVDQVNQVLALQPGVVASNSGAALSIRGGRDDEAATYVDGVPVQAGNRGRGFNTIGGNEIALGTNQIEEASITTGSSSAEFGNAQSGIISYATRTGGSKFQTRLAAESDEPFGKGTSIGFNRGEFNVSGPLTKALTFSIGASLIGQKSIESGLGAADVPYFVRAGLDTTVTALDSAGKPAGTIPVYNYAVSRGKCDQFASSTNANIASNFGQSCNGIRVPYSNSSNYQLQGKLNYSFGTGSRITLTGLGSQTQARRFNYGNSFGLSSLDGQRDWNRVYILNWTQQLTKSTERALALDVYLSYQQDRSIRSIFDTASFGGPGVGTLGFYVTPYKFQYDFNSFPLDQNLIDRYRDRLGNLGSPLPLGDDAEKFKTLSSGPGADRANPYGILNPAFALGGIVNRGNATTMYMNRENRWIGKANIDWQADRYNRLKFGGEMTRYDIFSYGHSYTDAFFSDVYAGRPVRWNGFIEDRLDLGDVVVVGGLRYDTYSSRNARPYLLDTVSTSPTFNQYQYFPRPSSYQGTFNGQPLTIYQLDQSHNYLSPHVQVSFPVTDRTNFRLSYAHQVESPDMGLVLTGTNTDLSITNSNQVFGTDLDFGKSITFEFGIRHAFSDDMVVDVAAYNKDNLANAAGRLVSTYDPTIKAKQDLRLLTNSDFGNTKGIDVRVDRRFGNFFNGTLAYTFTDAKNTGSDPYTYINIGSRIVNAVSGGNQPPPQAIAPTTLSRPHVLAGAASLSFPSDFQKGSFIGTLFGNFSTYVTFRYQSGTAYTTCTQDAGNDGVFSGVVCAKGQTNGLNATRLPAFKNLDARFTKGFKLGGTDITAYLDARNLLNLRNVTRVFVNTRDIVNPADEELRYSSDSSSFAGEGKANGVLLSDGSLDLRFAGNGASGCATYQVGVASSPQACVYLIRAEQRYGNGDGVLTIDEQRKLSDALYLTGTNSSVTTGQGGRQAANFLSPGRRLRLGVELSF
jgi:hypothetical protein